jgi:hypothetical protein
MHHALAWVNTPLSTPVACRPRLESGATRLDERPALEARRAPRRAAADSIGLSSYRLPAEQSHVVPCDTLTSASGVSQPARELKRGQSVMGKAKAAPPVPAAVHPSLFPPLPTQNPPPAAPNLVCRCPHKPFSTRGSGRSGRGALVVAPSSAFEDSRQCDSGCSGVGIVQ